VQIRMLFCKNTIGGWGFATKRFMGGDIKL
jgi:hypothetical protein